MDFTVRNKHALLPLPLAAALLLVAAPAEADTVGRNFTGYQKISKGVFELGVESLLLVRQNSAPIPDTDDGTVSSLDLAFTGGLTPRYFVADNFAVGLNANFFMRKASLSTEVGGETTETSEDDTGFLGFVMANYYLRMGNSFFFKPGLGAGYFTGTRSEPVVGAESQIAQSQLGGFAGRLDLGVAFYASRHVNFKAGADLIYRNGDVTPDEGDPISFSSLDAGFNIGMAYSF